jgi:hypothetical protein
MSGSNGMRLGVETTYSSVFAATPTCTVTFKVYSENKYAYSDTQTLTYSGTAGVTGTFNFTNNQGAWDGPGGTGPTLRDTKTWVYTYPPTGLGVSKTFTATLSGAFNNVTPTVTVTATPPNRGAAPSAVTELHLEYVSDTQGIVTWNNPGGAITTNTVMRQEIAYGSGAWVDITPPFTSPSPIETLTSNSLRPNMLFRFQVRANNAVGSGPYAISNLIFTTPAAPGDVQAVRQSNGSVTLSWTVTHPPTNQGQAGTRYTQRIERSPDGTVWSVVNPQFIPTSSGTQTWTDATASTGAMRYRVITITPDGLESAPGVSNDVASSYAIYGGSQSAITIYAGSLFAHRIYQGTVLVWEKAKPLPPANGVATWKSGGVDALTITDSLFVLSSGVRVIDVGLFGTGTPTSVPVSVRHNNQGIPIALTPPHTWTVAEAVTAWAGNRVAFTIAANGTQRTITNIEVLGPTPPEICEWSQGVDGILRLTLVHREQNLVYGRPYVGAVPTFSEPLLHPEFRLGTAQTSGMGKIWYRFKNTPPPATLYWAISPSAHASGGLTNQSAVSFLAGRNVVFTTNATTGTTLDHIDVL